jgi:Tol biopolymer transport system component
MAVRIKTVLALLLVASAFLSAAVGLRGCMNEHSRPVGHGDIAFDISPSGEQIVFSALGDGGRDLFLLDLKTWQVTALIQSPDYEGTPAFSPDGKFIIYAAGTPGDRADHLYLRSLDGSQVRQLTNEDYNDQEPSFSADGSQIVFTRNLTYNGGGLAASWGSDGVVCTMKPDGTQLRRMTNVIWPTEGSHVSSDGKLIVFARGGYSPDYEIYIRNVKSGATRQLTNMKDGCFKPRFTPDAKHVFFMVESWLNGPSGVPQYSLWRIDTNGKNAVEIAGPRLFDDPLHWEPLVKGK